MRVIEKLKIKAKLLKRDITALYLAYKRPETPWYAKAFTAVVVAYAVSPIDLIPDFIPILGYLDDLLLLPLGIAAAVKMIPGPVMEECRKEAEAMDISGKLQGFWCAAIILLFWVAAVYFIVNIIK